MFGKRLRRMGRDGFDFMRGGCDRDRMAWDGDGFDPRRGGGFFGKAFGGREGHGGRRGGRFFAHGGLRLIMLAMLAEQPRHGYEIIKAIEDRMGGAYVPSAGVVYPTLTLLEETGQIEVVQSEGAKKLYAITAAGRDTLAANNAQVEAMMARMDAAGAERSAERDPRVVRAIESLKLALRLKLTARPLDATQTAALVALLDETTARIEAL